MFVELAGIEREERKGKKMTGVLSIVILVGVFLAGYSVGSLNEFVPMHKRIRERLDLVSKRSEGFETKMARLEEIGFVGGVRKN